MRHTKPGATIGNQDLADSTWSSNVSEPAAPEGDSPHINDDDPLSDDIEIIDDDQVDEIGDLGNERDEALDLDALMRTLDGRQPTRFSFLMSRASECMRALASMRSGPASPWPQDRVPEAHWRALADEALGLIGSAVKKEFDHQALVESLPQGERANMRRLLDSSIGMQVFRDAFARERAGWERAFWRMALDQSFGKKPWTGPSGWRRVARRSSADASSQNE